MLGGPPAAGRRSRTSVVLPVWRAPVRTVTEQKGKAILQRGCKPAQAVETAAGGGSAYSNSDLTAPQVAGSIGVGQPLQAGRSPVSGPVQVFCPYLIQSSPGPAAPGPFRL